MGSFRVFGILTLLAFGAEDEHEGHGHDDHGDEAGYEWAGVFETQADAYVWIAQKVDGDYADPTMDLVALSSKSATAEALDELDAEGRHSMGQNCSHVYAGGTLVPKEDACYRLHFDELLPTTIFKVDASSVTSIAFFAQHFPTEFESDTHYFKNASGTDIEPQAELPKVAEPEKDWLMPILSAISVNMITLVGVVFLVPGLKKALQTHPTEFQSLMSAFAAGAILSCAFYLLLFEATHMIGVGWKEEVEVLWRWGTMILAGFVFPAICDCLVCLMLGGDSRKMADDQQSDDQRKVETATDPVTRWRLVSSICIGDFFHNLCDGFFLAAAFTGCGFDFGWRVAIGTIAHEFAQELADYVILTGPDAGLTPAVALALNFLSGLGVLLGALIVLSVDVGDAGVGLILAWGGGVYIHVAATDCMPKVYEKSLKMSTRAACLLAFLVGAIGIGLVLLDHEHCVPAGGDPHGH